MSWPLPWSLRKRSSDAQIRACWYFRFSGSKRQHGSLALVRSCEGKGRAPLRGVRESVHAGCPIGDYIEQCKGIMAERACHREEVEELMVGEDAGVKRGPLEIIDQGAQYVEDATVGNPEHAAVTRRLVERLDGQQAAGAE